MQTESILDRGGLAQRWLELCADPRTPPYFELNQFGETVTRPQPSMRHQCIARCTARELDAQLGPEAAVEVPLLTDQGVRVPDVIWMRPSRWARWRDTTPLPFAPDVCLEVLSPGDPRDEIEMRTGAYLRAGVREVILVASDGRVVFVADRGRRNVSALGVMIFLPD